MTRPLSELTEDPALQRSLSHIEQQTVAIVDQLRIARESDPWRQLALKTFRYCELLGVSQKLIECLAIAPTTNPTRLLVASMQAAKVFKGSACMCAVRRHLIFSESSLPTGQKITESLPFASLYADASSDSRVGIIMLLFTLQLHEQMRPYLMDVARNLNCSELMRYHLDAYESAMDFRDQLVKVLANEQTMSNMTNTVEAIYEIADAVRTMFWLYSAVTLRPSSFREISHLPSDLRHVVQPRLRHASAAK